MAFSELHDTVVHIVHPFKEELRYATVLKMVNTIADINDVLVKKGYALNVYERKHNTFLVDIIKTRMQNNIYIISVVKALYWYADLQGDSEAGGSRF